LVILSQELMLFDPNDVDAKVIAYVHDIGPSVTGFFPISMDILTRRYINRIKQCSIVICASKATRDDLRYRIGFTGNTHVIYQGINYEDTNGVNNDIDILYVGSFQPRKDPSLIKESFNMATDNGYRCVAVNYQKIDVSGEVYVDISEQELQTLLGQTRYYLHPSRFEGFGRGPVEAQAHGAIPLAKDIPINNEILGTKGKAWKSIDSSSPNQILDFIQLPLTKDEKQAAKRNASKYTWQKMKSQLTQVLHTELK